MKLRDIIAAWFAEPLFIEQPSLATSSVSTINHHDGLVIGYRPGIRKRNRFVRYPDGEFRLVDNDFDASVFDDPDSMSKAQRKAAKQDLKPRVVPDVEPATNAVQRIAVAMQAVSPSSLISVVHDSTGTVVGATITPAKRGLTAAVFRAAFRSAPEKTKQVTFAARKGISQEVRDAANAAADTFLVRILGFIVTE